MPVKPIIFKLNHELYGIDIAMVSSIEQEQNVVRVPNVPRCIKGIINLRGEIIPVYDLCKKFDCPPVPQGKSQLIITRTGTMQVAIEVEEISEIHEISVEEISEVPKIIQGSKTSYIKEIAKMEKQLVIILDVNELVSEEEEEDIQNFLSTQK